MNDLLMFDFESFYDRIAEQMPHDCKVCEVGIANADSVIYLTQRLVELGKNPKVYAVDSMQYGGFIQMKVIYQNIIKSGLGEYIEVIPKESLDAVNDFNDGYLDFVFIDSSHTYEQTKLEIPVWYKKCKDEAILSGHDFFAPEVNKAVIETIPDFFTRTDIKDRTFEPEQILHSEDTRNHFGVWWLKKQWYIKL